MKLEFSSLAVTNFKCFVGEPVVLDFAKFFPGLHFVKGVNEVNPELGANGCGKSSLADAMTWCLYGKTVDGLRGPDIIPWNSGGGSTQVILSLQRDGKPYQVERTAPNNRLTVNGKIVGQEQIDHDLMSFAIFTNTLLLGQGRPLFFDLKPQGKMDLFTDVLDLDRWEVRSQAAAVEVKDLELREVRTSTELDAARSSLQELRSLFKVARLKADDWEATRLSLFEALEDKIVGLRVIVEILDEEVADLKSAQDDFRKELKLAKGRLEDEEDDYRGLLVKCKQLVAGRKNDERLLKVLEQEQLDLSIAKKCPTCGQSVTKANLIKHSKELAARIAELRKLLDSDKLEILERDLIVAEDLVKGTKQIVGELDHKLFKTIDELRARSTEQAKAVAQLQEAEQSLKQLTEEGNPHAGTVKDLRLRISNQREQIVNLSEDLTKLRRRIDRVSFWVKGFKACRLYLLEEVLEDLQLVSNAVCPELGLDGWEIRYSVEKENKSGSISRGLNVEIVSPDSDRTIRWESFSGGEQQRLRLIGALSLSEVLLNHAGIDSDLEALDEPTRHLSVSGVQDLCELLPDRAIRLNRKTLFVDHHVIESHRFASVLTVRRTRNGVRVNEDGWNERAPTPRAQETQR